MVGISSGIEYTTVGFLSVVSLSWYTVSIYVYIVLICKDDKTQGLKCSPGLKYMYRDIVLIGLDWTLETRYLTVQTFYTTFAYHKTCPVLSSLLSYEWLL